MPEITLKGFQCERCEHKWLPKEDTTKDKPKVCPKCKSPYWDTPRRKHQQEMDFKEKRRLR
jgi:hypothetical protein